jgi:Putative Flp pilus-assembly TadE/G-like
MGRLRHEAGQTVVLFAVLLPLFLGVGAIAVDVGYWYVVKKSAQDAADAAALAAARELPNRDVAITRGQEYVGRNMPGATAIVDTPYSDHGVEAGVSGGGGPPDPFKVEVVVRHPAGTFFGRLFGIFDLTVTTRAVAERTSSDSNLAIFSWGDNCGDGLEFSAEGVSVNGHIHSNGQFRISVGPFWAANGTYDVDMCTASKDETAVSRFGDDPTATLPLEDANRPWPVWFTPAQFGWFSGCTYEAATIQITDTEVRLADQVIPYSGRIPSGTYCASESVVIDASDVSGAVTVLAPQIAVNGGNLTLTPFSQDVLFFAVPNSDNTPNDGPPPDRELHCVPGEGTDMWLNGSGHRWSGIVFNPCGRTIVNVGDGQGGGAALEGAIVGNRIRVEGNGFDMIGKGSFEYTTALVE